MNKFAGVLLSLTMVAAFALPARSARAADGEQNDDFSIRFLHRVQRWQGGATSPLQEKLIGKLESMSAMENGAGGGFEPPPETGTQPAATDDDSQYAALQDIMTKMGPLERLKTEVWFLIIRPTTKHRDELQRAIDQQATTLKPNEQTDFTEYMAVRRSLAGASYSSRVDRWQTFAKSKPGSTFSDLANREVTYVKSIEKDNSTEAKAGVFRVFVKIGIAVVILALLAAIILGAAK